MEILTDQMKATRSKVVVEEFGKGGEKEKK